MLLHSSSGSALCVSFVIASLEEDGEYLACEVFSVEPSGPRRQWASEGHAHNRCQAQGLCEERTRDTNLKINQFDQMA